LELLGHFGEVHEVVALGDLAVAPGGEGGAEDDDLFPGCGKAEGVSGVSPAAGPADGDAVSFGDEVVEVDAEVAEGVAKAAVDGSEALGADENGVWFGKAVDLALRVKELVDGRFPSLIPDFFNSPFYEGLVLL